MTGTSLVICSRTRTTSSTCGLKAKPVQVQAHPSPPGSNPGTDCTDLHRLSGGSVSCSCRTNARCSAPLPLGCDGSPGSAPYLCRSGAGVCRAPEPPRRTWTCRWKPPQALFLVPHARLRCVAFSPFLAGGWATSGRQTGGSPQLGLGAVRAASLRACEPAPVAEVAGAKKCGDVASECCAKSPQTSLEPPRLRSAALDCRGGEPEREAEPESVKELGPQPRTELSRFIATGILRP